PAVAFKLFKRAVTIQGVRHRSIVLRADLKRGLREIGERKTEESGSPSTVWQVYDVTCPACRKEPGAWCRSPGRPHALRYKLAAEFTQQRKPHLETKSSQQDVYLAAPDAPEL
ncbi:hypothetical protein AB0D56_37285, partial [Streptomyces sp. NPDC048209]|uniref:zinc finger domain-containing protein n=1 Tax=Streptomyces sp. NPDC048209 TaxID=3156689 RepID=UPI00342D0D24